jgi:hypothetical protein
MSNKDQTELGANGQNLFARDFYAPHVLAYMKIFFNTFHTVVL